MESLFIYGTLCSENLRRKILRKPSQVFPASLEHFVRRDGRWPYIVPCENATLHGYLLQPLTKLDLKRLDIYEEVTPRWYEGRMRCFYRRECVTVWTRGQVRKECWVYLPNLGDWPLAWL